MSGVTSVPPAPGTAAAPAPLPRATAPVARRWWRLGAVGGVLWLALWAILTVRVPIGPRIEPGQPSPLAVQASRTVTYISIWRTEQERSRAERDPATLVYQRDPTVPVQQRLHLLNLLQAIAQIRDDPTLDAAAASVSLAALSDSAVVIAPETSLVLATLPDETWEIVRRTAIELYDRAMSTSGYSITEDELTEIRERSLPYWASLSGDEQTRPLILWLSGTFLKANHVLDGAATAQAREQARAAVEPVTVRILQGESIVREGDVVTADVEEKLRAIDALQLTPSWSTVLGHGLIAAIVAALFTSYVALAQPPVWHDDRTLLLTVGLLLGTVLTGRWLTPLGPSWAAAFPLATIALLNAALFRRSAGIIVAVLSSLFVAFLADGQLSSAVAYLVGAVAGIFALRRGERSLHFVVAGLAVAGGMVVARTAFTLITAGQLDAATLARIGALGALNGALSAVLALGLYHIIGHISGMTTPLRLMELAHPAQPLLRRLIREAPGTYAHSVAVGNLAESAAEAIGADALLLRVGSYYHDIGKLVQPYFFSDNQSDGANPHQALAPDASAAIIIGHVSTGERMARAAGLPEPIVDLICTHHGSGVIKHFYHLALAADPAADAARFSYPGPRPRTREEGILMLADTVEATVRSKVQHGRVVATRDRVGGDGGQTLDELVESIIAERLASGQLDQCALTLADMQAIRRAFLVTLHGIYHPRVEYAPAPASGAAGGAS